MKVKTKNDVMTRAAAIVLAAASLGSAEARAQVRDEGENSKLLSALHSAMEGYKSHRACPNLYNDAYRKTYRDHVCAPQE